MKILIQNIKKYYQNRLVLDIENLNIDSGKITGILGPNGSGKSTLMTIVAGLNIKDKGTVKYDGSDFSEVKGTVTYVSNNSYLFNDTVYNNIAFPLKFRKYSSDNINKIVSKLIETFDIKHLSDKSALNLSSGERQKVCLARAISFKPKLLIVDEPTSNLDPNFVRLIENVLINENIENRTTILIVTHNTNQALRICDNIIFLKDGSILYNGDAKEIRHSRIKLINDFIELY